MCRGGLAVSVRRDKRAESVSVRPSWSCECEPNKSVCVCVCVWLKPSSCIMVRRAHSWCKPQSWSSAACSHVRSLGAPLASQAVSASLSTACTARRSSGSQCRPRRRTPRWAPRPGTSRCTGRPPTCRCRCRTSSGWPRRAVWGQSPATPCPVASASRPRNRCLSRGAGSPAQCSWWWVSALRPVGGWVRKTVSQSVIWFGYFPPNAPTMQLLKIAESFDQNQNQQDYLTTFSAWLSLWRHLFWKCTPLPAGCSALWVGTTHQLLNRFTFTSVSSCSNWFLANLGLPLEVVLANMLANSCPAAQPANTEQHFPLSTDTDRSESKPNG